jgi:hypothetical protein
MGQMAPHIVDQASGTRINEQQRRRPFDKARDAQSPAGLAAAQGRVDMALKRVREKRAQTSGPPSTLYIHSRLAKSNIRPLLDAIRSRIYQDSGGVQNSSMQSGAILTSRLFVHGHLQYSRRTKGDVRPAHLGDEFPLPLQGSERHRLS